MSSVTDGSGIAAGVGVATDTDGGRFRTAAAWAWLWRSFDMSLPDVGGAAWQTDVATDSSPGPQARDADVARAESEGYTRYLAYGPW
ncbi:hypothetical protein EES41_40875 (plasmid) [Streptomyces sp. ADI95-16]|nr:hypothetical protein EES41_40875 [Streptomyces sp. ADI95-16]RPK23945.1 hypothetical protein EES37_37610 [Streptomyces sp. ADI91-18]